ncbi:ATP-binding protein [Cohnella luojiensis]|uniref:histidine kinase n=1 Tax=Cohnella luojiensis TaxID=652876 RepID=A0A4Y8LPC0_9BACL|nr:ATP-binding protein [Cohnella luojiensis]TFE22855.1 PAS domain-containing protein [Cohnella luojiensis]
MWKDTLLQVLISFLPVFSFMVWYSKPERIRQAHIFLGVACGIAMMLNAHYTMVNEDGVCLDFRYIPLIIGSLYGGIPVAGVLLVVYIITRLNEFTNQWDYILFAMFIIIYIPVLYTRISIFDASSRKGRLKVVAVICLLIAILRIAVGLSGITNLKFADVSGHLLGGLIFGLSIMGLTLVCAHFIELCYDRIELQIQLHNVSNKYRKEMRRLQQFIDNSPLLVVFCNNRGFITHVNDVAIKFIGSVGRNDILGQKFSDILKKVDVQFEADPVERVLLGEDKLIEIIRLNGRTFYTVSCSIQDMPSHGTDGVLFIGHDVTELQRLKDEVDKMERLSLVGQMAASITHEIRNPMAVIRGFVQLLNERSPEDQQSYFRIVLDELDRANAIINDFLSLAQNRIVEKEPSNLNDLLNDLLPLIWADANMRGQIIDLRLSESMDILHVNSKEMKQLILNLARNGMEAMNDKGILRIETLNLQDTVQLRVVDNGVGIPQEKLERLFEPFYTTKTNGTGLGLALCLSIVERHSGKIHVESAVGQGTSFIVSFCKPGRYCW